MRFGVTDPIVKGMLRCTNTVVASEASISKSEKSAKVSTSDEPRTSQGEMETPSHQKNVSPDIVPNYTIYLLSYRDGGGGGVPVIGVVEVKRKVDFNDKSVCQTIGYHVASHFINACSSPEGDTIIPPLLVLVCQDKLKFIFLPFMCEGHHCTDAPSIPIFEGNLLSESRFSFVFTL